MKFGMPHAASITKLHFDKSLGVSGEDSRIMKFQNRSIYFWNRMAGSNQSWMVVPYLSEDKLVTRMSRPN